MKEKILRILLTGGAGFIGSNFVRMFAAGNFPLVESVIVVDKLSYAGDISNIRDLVSTRIQFVQGDVCDRNLIDSLTACADVVLNFAAESHVDRSIANATVFTTTNILGTQTLLDCAIKNKVSLYFQISTDEVYGSVNSGESTEDSALVPNSPYSASKAGADLMVRAYSQTHGLKTMISRCTNNFGHFQHPEKLIPRLIIAALGGEKLPIYGSGLNIREWIHVDDHCRAIYQLLVSGRHGQVYNIGSGIRLSNLDVANTVLRLMDLPIDRVKFVEDRKGHDFRYSVNTEKIFKDVGFVAQVDFEKGLLETIGWYQANRSWWERKISR